MSLSTIKRLKFIIKAYRSIMREEGSGRPAKVIRDSYIYKKNYIFKLITDSSFNTTNIIV